MADGNGSSRKKSLFVAIEAPQIHSRLKANRDIMKDSSLSRRRCLQLSALAGCSLILTGRGLIAQEPLPADYIRPGPITARGKAPDLRSQLLSQRSSRTYDIIYGKYDEFMAGLTEFAENNQLKASHFTAIGAFHERFSDGSMARRKPTRRSRSLNKSK